MYFIYGEENFFINQQIDKIIKENPNFDKLNFEYNNDEDLTKLIDLLSQVNIFGSNKIYIIKNLIYFEKSIAKNKLETSNKIASLIVNNTEDIFIFVNQNITNKEKIATNNFTNQIFKNPNKKVFLAECNKVDSRNIIKTTQDIAKRYGGEIEYQAVNELLKKIPNDLSFIDSEIFKLVNENPQITLEMINTSVSDIYSDDAFGFSNSFESNNLGNIWYKYREKILEGVDVNILIAQVSQLLSIAYQIYVFYKLNLDLDQVAESLKLNKYRVKKINYLLLKLGIKKIRKMILSLALLDKDIKSGFIEAQIGFERFLIKYFAN